MKIQAENKSLLLNPNFSISIILLNLHPTNAEIPVPPSRSKKSSAMYFIISKGFSRLPTLKSYKTLNPDTLMRHRIIQIAITINVARVLVVGIRS